jgi:hypothetical protein
MRLFVIALVALSVVMPAFVDRGMRVDGVATGTVAADRVRVPAGAAIP